MSTVASARNRTTSTQRHRVCTSCRKIIPRQGGYYGKICGSCRAAQVTLRRKRLKALGLQYREAGAGVPFSVWLVQENHARLKSGKVFLD